MKKKKHKALKKTLYIHKVLQSPITIALSIAFLFLAVVMTVAAFRFQRSVVSQAADSRRFTTLPRRVYPSRAIQPTGFIQPSMKMPVTLRDTPPRNELDVQPPSAPGSNLPTAPGSITRPSRLSYMSYFGCEDGEDDVRSRMYCSFRDRLMPILTQNMYTRTEGGVSVYTDSFSVSEWGTYEVSVYYPSDTASAPYPVILFAPGSASSKDYYTSIGNFLAGSGYVALLFSPPNIMQADPQKTIDGFVGALAYIQNSGQNTTLSGIVDTNAIGLSGHSLGSMAALVVAANDTGVSALSVLAPGYPEGDQGNAEMSELMRNASLNVSQPTQLQVGSLDKISKPSGSYNHYQQLPATKEYIEINGANHVGFLDGGLISLIASLFDNKAEISGQEQLAISKKYMVAWFDYFLKNDQSAYDTIFGSIAQNDLNTGVLSRLELEE